jgi:hypothetical protein
VVHRLVREELRNKIEAAVAEAQSVEDHCHRRRAYAHRLPIPGLLLIQPVGDPDFPTDLGHQAQMIEMFDDVL